MLMGPLNQQKTHPEMKRYIIMAVLASLLLASCHSAAPEEPQNDRMITKPDSLQKTV